MKKLKATDLKIGIVIGPEGGFEESDIKLLKETSGSIKYQYLKKYPEVIKKVDDLSQKIIEK